ncbi:MAG: hypothetical protein WA919_28670 [Coleofasciculaceae cyanobacterium]
MAHLSKEESQQPTNTKVDITTKIWGFATGILAICVPLSAVTKSGPLLPFAVITGATVSTGIVWQSEEKKSDNGTSSANNLAVLEERIANLEMILSSEELNFQRKIQQLESKSNLKNI